MNFESFIQQGELHAWLFFPVAVLLGAMHGLEPGHSKTMMAGFIIAIRGTIAQAVLLGLSAALSHTAIIWILAAIGLRYGRQWNVEAAEPYIQIGTGVLVGALALWSIIRLRRERNHNHSHPHAHPHDHGHSHAEDHAHSHHEEVKALETKLGTLSLSIYEENVPPRFRTACSESVQFSSAAITTKRPDGSEHVFSMAPKQGYWESVETIPEPHDFRVEVALSTPDGLVRTETEFSEEDHVHSHGSEEEDAHSRMHADEIKRRFEGRHVTTPQIVLFGLTGGLMPCPAALSILLICLQLKRALLGFTLVAAFGLGLALTMVSVGVAAAWGAKKLSSGSNRFAKLARNAPYFSSTLLLVLAAFLVARGILGLS